MFKSIALLTALVVATATMAKADQISINGSDSYNVGTTTLTFNGPTDGSGNPLGSIGGKSTGIFSSFGDCFGCVTLQKGTINYGPSFSATEIFSTTSGANSLTVTLLNIKSLTNQPGNLTIIGDADLDLNGTIIAGVLNLTSQSTDGSTTGVTFSASTSPVPEPASLALFGSGLLGIVGLARRRFNV